MRYLIIIMIVLNAAGSFAQSDQGYMIRMARQAGIRQPVPPGFASLTVKRPIKMDSLSLIDFRRHYIQKMQAGTVVEAGGALILVSHILIAALVPHFNFPLVVTLATVGVASMTAGSILLPIGASERHRYKKTLRIALAKRGCDSLSQIKRLVY